MLKYVSVVTQVTVGERAFNLCFGALDAANLLYWDRCCLKCTKKLLLILSVFLIIGRTSFR